MHTETHTGLDSPKGNWWRPAHRSEKVWVGIAFAWCMVLFAMMPLWHWKVGEDRGMPIVAPPPGSDIYLVGMAFQWMPILKLQKGAQYTLHLSALDVNHGFSLFPVNVNFQVVPGYDYGLRITPTEAGDFRVMCNEFCGIGHHLMLGRIIVTEGEGVAAASAGGASGAGSEGET